MTSTYANHNNYTLSLIHLQLVSCKSKRQDETRQDKTRRDKMKRDKTSSLQIENNFGTSDSNSNSNYNNIIERLLSGLDRPSTFA